MKQNSNEAPDSDTNKDYSTSVTRRKFFGDLGKATTAVAALSVASPFIDKRSSAQAAGKESGSFYHQRALDSYQFRVNCAKGNFEPIPPKFARPGNGDEVLYPNRIASYSKGLQHKNNGEVEPAAYESLLNALRTGNPDSFEAVQIGGTVKLTNPQCGMAFDLEGKDAFTFVMPPAPAFAGREIAAEIAENYWMALLRDVPFDQYGSNPIAAAAAADLTLFGNDFKGAKNAFGTVNTDVLFRGLTPGDKIGPYISQFFYQDCNFGANAISQKIRTAVSGQNYMTNFGDWLAVQRGGATPNNVFDPLQLYMRNGRDIGQWVHIDVLFQAYFQAFLIIAGMGVSVDAGNPYKNSVTQIGFGTFGGPHIATLLCEVSTRALKTVWNQKWIVHRRLRPEVFAERADRALYNAAGYPVHPEILNSLSSGSRLGGYMPVGGNALLPMAFPEGSPTHPSYGAGHATVAGACVTILKAWFDESAVIPNPKMPSADGLDLVPYSGPELTVGGELNKIAANVALGRNIAGVHWRSDATESMKLGESIAISILKDQKASYNERFNGFSLTKFDGTAISV